MEDLIRRFLELHLEFDDEGNFYIVLSDGKVFKNFPEIVGLLHIIFDTIITSGFVFDVIREIKSK